MHKFISLLLITGASLGSITVASAEGFYGSASIGGSFQANDAEAFGENIAVDPDFPGGFDSGDGAVGSLALGYSFNNRLRLEGRVSRRNATFGSTEFGSGARTGEEFILDGDLQSTTITVEGFYDIPTHTIFTPYIKAGIGVAYNSYSARLGGAGVAAFDPFDGTVDGYYDNYSDETSTNFTWNAGFGTSIELNERVSLFGEYQYAYLGKATTGADAFTDGFEVDAGAHEFMAGVRVNF
ncbi:outer membrane beta-barrel protein [Halomonas qinghailakensis]|uniref:Outer membrane beta-barrel protein n=1 Tax=Halomonas qinghailakensis TaxID=2937790 RepID=A0AA46TQW9_9GAMM|nr:outer membrane beta-barrel protein [Halomonas sp. ZZQ-149]UYO74896.1 outer membrane beta-barrel protein [Halomonas sp. ZZQ-149]